jgi:predicted PP-loop superfamily ATPase
MKGDDPELLKLLRGLGRCQAQIEAELAKAKPDQAKIAVAFAAGKDFARDAAPYCHAECQLPPRMAA